MQTPLWEEKHRELFHQGLDVRAWEFFGVHPTADGAYQFRVWAPHARQVFLAGDFNGWDPGDLPLTCRQGIWEVRTDRLSPGSLYKYVIVGEDGSRAWKADPYAREGEGENEEGKAGTASRIPRPEETFPWEDELFLKKRTERRNYPAPINIYEVHPGSWKRHKDGSSYSYREVADALLPYVKEMGYTHIELLPLNEHPFGGSWGYQTTGYFALTSRYGSPADCRYLVNRAHKEGIGVILDWVPAHFAKDAHGLITFDGSLLYEEEDPLLMEHREWGTRAFAFGKGEVRSFLLASACFLISSYHLDGLRVDAVSAMLYRDYGRKDGEWSPNKRGGRENDEAVFFLRQLNRTVKRLFPGVLTIAEEATSWPQVTGDPDQGGLGFDFKWNMGWMNDSLTYFSTPPAFRKDCHHRLTFSMTYAFAEHFILPVSHDEVVHGKKALLDKMPGSYEEKFAGLRSFFTYMMTYPGKKLSFMGNEIGHFREWNEGGELDWNLLEFTRHRQIAAFVQDLNQIYRAEPALWRKDDSWAGFSWIDPDRSADCVLAYIRRGDPGEQPVFVFCNFSNRFFPAYRFRVPEAGQYTILLDSDSAKYGGAGRRQEKTWHTNEKGKRGTGESELGEPPTADNSRSTEVVTIDLPLPPLSCLLLKPNKKRGTQAE